MRREDPAWSLQSLALDRSLLRSMRDTAFSVLDDGVTVHFHKQSEHQSKYWHEEWEIANVKQLQATENVVHRHDRLTIGKRQRNLQNEQDDAGDDSDQPADPDRTQALPEMMLVIVHGTSSIFAASCSCEAGRPLPRNRRLGRRVDLRRCRPGRKQGCRRRPVDRPDR